MTNIGYKTALTKLNVSYVSRLCAVFIQSMLTTLLSEFQKTYLWLVVSIGLTPYSDSVSLLSQVP